MNASRVDGRIVAPRLVRLRKIRKMSQNDLAARANALWLQDFPEATPIGVMWISRLERGLSMHVNLQRLTYVAHALDVPVADLLPLRDIPPDRGSGRQVLSEADVAVCLRRYGLSEAAVTTVLDYIDYLRSAKPRPRPPQDEWE